MKRRAYNTFFSLIIPAVLGGAFIIACIWASISTAKAKEYKTAVQSVYSGVYSGLVSEMSNLETELSKLQIVGTKSQYILLLDDVWHSCGTCSGYLAQVPASHADIAEMNSFIVRVGDYARVLAQNLLHGQAMTEKDMKQLSQMRTTCAELTDRISEHYKEGKYPDDIMEKDGYFSEAKYTTDETRQDYPTLIYDGPFSESAEKAKPKGLSGRIIEEKQGLACARQYLKTGCELEFVGENDGDIPTFEYSGKTADGNHVDIAVTKQGGALCWFMTEAKGDESGVPAKSITKGYEKVAKSYLSAHGYKPMQSTYAQYYNGIVLINFAYKEGDVIIYNDLVKVWVDRQTSEVIGLDARNYIYSHTERDIPDPEITKAEAKMLVSENLKVEQVRLALIPTSPEKEALCYEFKGKYAGDAYIVYINAVTGEEQQIFRIIDTEDGQLVI